MNQPSSNDLSGSVTGPVVQAGHVGSLHLTRPVPTALSGLPPAPPEFSGREEALRLLASALRPYAGGPPVAVSTLAGTAGVGKTALVLRAAHDAVAEGWFPGGVLFINLQGYDEARFVRPDVVLSSFLTSLGVPDEHFPATFEGRLALYRSKLAELGDRERAVLIVFDNASSTEQIRPLLPGHSVHRVLVSSRHTLGDLPGSRIVDLGVLTPEEAAALVIRTLRMRRPGDTRAQDDPDAVRDLAALCGHLPLALAVALSILAGEPDLAVEELTATLREGSGRLDELSYGGSSTVTAAFELSYARLSPDEARMFRLLSLNLGQQVSVEAAAALAGLPVPKARKLLGGLRGAHMIEPGRPRGWVRFHDLLRLFADQRLAEGEPEESVEAAADRLLAHYRDAAGNAVERIVEAARSGRRDEEMEDWLSAERTNLRRALQLAHLRGRFAVALPLAHNVSWVLRRRQEWDEGLEACEMAVRFARSLDGDAQYALALYNKADFLKHMQSYELALATFEESLELYRRIGDRAGAARTLHSMGTVNRRSGEFEAAEGDYALALALFEELADRQGMAHTLHNYGDTARQLGNHSEARARYELALEVYRQLDNRLGQARTLHHLGRLAMATEDLPGAAREWAAARTAYEEAGLPQYAQEVSELLAELEPDDASRGSG